MGIPSYFSFIVKNHGNIVRKIHKLNKNIDNFYLDSNSIVYDCLRALDKNYKDNDEELAKYLVFRYKMNYYPKKTHCLTHCILDSKKNMILQII